MTIVGDYIRGDDKAALIFGEVRSIIYIVGLVGSMDHTTGFGADLRFIGTLRAPLNVLPLLRLINPWGESKSQSNKSYTAKALKMGGNLRFIAKFTGWVLKELHVDTPLIGICSQISTNLWYGTTFGKLITSPDATKLTKSRQYLTLAMIPLGWTALAKANPNLIASGFLIAGLMGLRETQLGLHKFESAEKTS